MAIHVNNEDIEWEDMPEGFYLTDVKQHVLWKDEDSGAHFALVKFPLGSVHELPHTHPQASHWMFILSGAIERPDGTQVTWSENNYSLSHRPQGIQHGPAKGSQMKITQDTIVLMYFDGPHTRVFE
jgi:hypothetical protein